jgi:hypothetical protein
MILRPEELMDYVHNLLTIKKGELGLEYVVFGDGQLLPVYPAAAVVDDGLAREDHGTHMFLITISCDVFLMHANLGVDRAQRTREDLQLATRVVNLLHEDRSLGGEVVSSYVSAEQPNTVSTRNDTILGTQITFTAQNRERFR